MTTRIEKLKACNSKPDFARLLGIDPVFMTRVIYIYEILTIYIHSSLLKKRMVLIESYQPQTLSSKKYKASFPIYYKTV